VNVRPQPDWRFAEAVVCIASGPSLTAADCERVRSMCLPTIVTNTTFRVCPWADALFGFDYAWWRIHLEEVRATFAGRLFCQSARCPRRGVEWPGAFQHYRSFGNSGACAVALAIAARARRVVLLGYDGRAVDGRTHHHGAHPAPLRDCDTMPKWGLQFDRLARWAQARGVEILNATPGSSFAQFPATSLEQALGAERLAA